MAARTVLTDRKVQSLKAARKGTRYQVMDALVPGFGVRVTDAGIRSFILQSRFPGSVNPVRREIGRVGAVTLEAARDKAREWKALIRAGQDPAIVEERRRLAAALARERTFKAVAEDYFVRKLATLKSGARTRQRFERHLFPKLAKKPVGEITDLDVLAKVVNPRVHRTPKQAGQLLNDLKTFFNWVVEQRVYGLTVSPLIQLKTAKLVGKIKRRQRVLSDIELRALWIASTRAPAPVGPLYQTLILTALRLREVANTSRGEWDLRGGVWIIPGERMKGGLPHAVPLTEELRAIGSVVPNAGPYLFSYDGGTSPMQAGNGHAKQIINRLMLVALKEIAVERGDDPEMITLQPWVNHDIRRTVRTRLSRLKVPEDAREAILAHIKPGIERTYDVHDYLDEKHEALTTWAAELHRIVAPQPDNVVALRRV